MDIESQESVTEQKLRRRKEREELEKWWSERDWLDKWPYTWPLALQIPFTFISCFVAAFIIIALMDMMAPGFPWLNATILIVFTVGGPVGCVIMWRERRQKKKRLEHLRKLAEGGRPRKGEGKT